MANNLTVSYKGNTIHTASASGSATLNTEGKYMEDNVSLSYTFEGGIDPSDATATASDILSGKTAYTADGKVTGNIAIKTSANMTVNGATVTAPAGYYATAQSKSVSSGSATTPATIITANPTVTKSGSNIVATVSKTQSITPTVSAGYVSSGTAGNATVSGSATIAATSLDANLVAGNIKKDVAIFGVTGSYEGGVTVEALSVTANGTYTAPTGKAYSPVTVNVSGGGGGGASKNDVNFYDYDGTIVASYSASEFANLTALPDNPSHTGLTAQGWNWTLANAKTYVANYGKLDVGQMYITSDGKTRIYIHLEDGRLAPYLGIAIDGTATVDWGDGSTSTVTGTSTSTVISTQHTYAAVGDYVIAIAVSGSMALVGSIDSRVLWKNSATGGQNRTYQSAIQKVEIGANTSIGDSAFYNCYSLASITIPSGVTSIGNNAFQSCYSLASITIPSGVTSIGGDGAFYYCTSLASITIPSGVTSIDTYAFYNCYSLASITIPSGVTSIGNNAFQSCSSLASITIPSNVTSIRDSAFQNCYSLASITIPSNVTSIGAREFQSCYSLASITIPSNVTSIGNYAFSNCHGLGYIKFTRSTPPTVSNSNAWTNVPTDCIIYVPRGSLSAYKSATKYPSSSTYTYVEY